MIQLFILPHHKSFKCWQRQFSLQLSPIFVTQHKQQWHDYFHYHNGDNEFMSTIDPLEFFGIILLWNKQETKKMTSLADHACCLFWKRDIFSNNTTKALHHDMKNMGLCMKIYTYIISTFYPKRYTELFELRVFSKLKRMLFILLIFSFASFLYRCNIRGEISGMYSLGAGLIGWESWDFVRRREPNYNQYYHAL